jgi:hypothetical protein
MGEIMIKDCLSSECTSERKNSGQGCIDPTITFVGATLATYEQNGYDDSDFYAIVWDAEIGHTRHINYASTRSWTYHNSAKVDATPEIIALAEIELAATLAQCWIEQAELEASKPVKGRMVKSLTTRGKNVGITGVVMWYGVDQYKSDRYLTVYKVGVKVEGDPKLRYLAADAVAVIDPEPVNPAEIIARAKIRASQHGWRTSL